MLAAERGAASELVSGTPDNELLEKFEFKPETTGRFHGKHKPAQRKAKVITAKASCEKSSENFFDRIFTETPNLFMDKTIRRCFSC